MGLQALCVCSTWHRSTCALETLRSVFLTLRVRMFLSVSYSSYYQLCRCWWTRRCTRVALSWLADMGEAGRGILVPKYLEPVYLRWYLSTSMFFWSGYSYVPVSRASTATIAQQHLAQATLIGRQVCKKPSARSGCPPPRYTVIRTTKPSRSHHFQNRNNIQT